MHVSNRSLPQVRETILPHVATLGYGPKMVKIVERVAPHDPHGVLASCALRLLHQFSNSKSIVKSIMAQCEIVKPMATLKATLMPLHKDAPFTFEIIRKMVEENSVQAAKRDSVSSAAYFYHGDLLYSS